MQLATRNAEEMLAREQSMRYEIERWARVAKITGMKGS